MGLKSAKEALDPYRAKIRELETEVAALRKRRVVDEAMLARAVAAYNDPKRPGLRMLCALEAALGKDEDNGNKVTTGRR